MKKLFVKFLSVIALAVGFSLPSFALNNVWQTMCEDVAYMGSTAPANLQYASSQRGLAMLVNIAEDATKTAYTILDYNGDNRVQLLITAEGKYQLKVNSGSMFNVVSDVDVTAGRHIFALMVRRGKSGGGSHIISVIVYLDGEQIFKVGDGSTAFVTGPFRNISFGTSGSANRVTGILWNATEGCGSDSTDAATIAKIVADADSIFAQAECSATVSEACDWNDIVWEPAIEDPEATKLLLTVENNAVITLDGTASKYGEVEITGDVTFVAPDSLYEDGCWQVNLLQTSAFSADGTVSFAALKEGFKGGYAQTSTGIVLRGQNHEVISINIAGGSGGGSGTDSPSANLVSGSNFYGIYPTLGDSWNNINRQWQSGGNKTISIVGPNAYDGEQVIKRDTMSLSATGKNTWQCDSVSNPFLRGYLDDGNGVSVTVEGVPYTKYDVIIYGTSDRSDTGIAPIIVNGTSYTCVDGETVEGNTAWGVGASSTPAVGQNAIKVCDCSGDTLTVSATRKGYTGDGAGRATISAVQVICKGDVVFKQNYVADITGDVSWTKGQDDNLISYGDVWENGQLSTLELTNTESNVTLTFAEYTSGKSFTFVSRIGNSVTIPATCLSNLEFGSYDFSEAFGGVTIDLTDVTAEATTLMTGPISGVTNFTFTAAPEGFGGCADESGIFLAPVANATRENPLSGESVSFKNTYCGEDGVWSATTNWLKAVDGLWITASKIPGVSGGDLNSILVDGALVNNKVVAVDTLDGYNIRYAFLNGAQVTAMKLNKIQTGSEEEGNAVPMWIWVDDTSKFTVESLSSNSNWGELSLSIAGEEGLVFLSEFNKSATLNYAFGENGSVVYESGISAGTHNLNGGALKVGGAGITGGKLNVTNSTVVTFTNESATVAATVNIAPESTLTLALQSGITTNMVNCRMVNEGTLAFTGNATVVLVTDGDPGNVDVGDCNVIFAYRIDINNAGRFKIPAGKTAEDMLLFDQQGNPVEITSSDEEYVYYDWQYQGTAAWWDFEFEGDLKNAGSGKPSALTWDGGSPISSSEAYATDEETGLQALKIPCRPYCSVSYPEVLTVVMYGKMVPTDKTVQVGFGSATDGSRNVIYLATGSVADDEVKLCMVHTLNEKATELCSMTVSNAQSENHLYAFVLKTNDEGNTEVDTYLDGRILQPYTFEGKVTLGGGFQVGSIHGGVGATGYTAGTVDDATATLSVMLAYDVELNAEAMARLAEIYPYESPNGNFERTFAENGNWVDDSEPWERLSTNGTVSAAQPAAMSKVKATASEDVEVTVNLDGDVAYEELELAGDGVITFAPTQGGKIVANRATINTSAKIDANALYISGPMTLAADVTVDFDMTKVVLNEVWNTTTYYLSGLVSLGEGAKVTAYFSGDSGEATLELGGESAVIDGREISMGIDSHAQQLYCKVECTPVEADLDATASFSELEWRLGDLSVTPDWSKVSEAIINVNDSSATLDFDSEFSSEITFDVNGSLTMSNVNEYDLTKVSFVLTEGESFTIAADNNIELGKVTASPVVKNGEGSVTIAQQNGADYIINAGTLAFSSVASSNGVITVESGAIFDVNGTTGSNFDIVLNGGMLMNYGEAVGDTSQTKKLTLTADSMIGGSEKFAIQTTSYGATTIDLGEYTLTKQDDNQVSFVNTTILGSGVLDITGGKVYSSENTVFTNGTLRLSEGGTFDHRAGRKLIIANVEGAGGTFANNGTSSGFTFTGNATLTGGSDYGIITMVSSEETMSTLNIGKLRGFTFSGEGSINVELTPTEFTNGVASVFSVTNGTVTIASVTYESVPYEFTAEGGEITSIVKGGSEWSDIEDAVVDGVTDENREAVETTLAAILVELGEGASAEDVGTWLASVYGDTKVSADKLAAAQNIDVSVRFDLPLMENEPTIEVTESEITAESGNIVAFEFTIKDGGDAVAVSQAKLEEIQKAVEYTDALGVTDFAESTDTEVAITLSGTTIKAELKSVEGKSAGFMRLKLK